MKIPNKKYPYPLLINGERYWLNKDPFIYAEEGALKYYPEKIEKIANELLWEEYLLEKKESSPMDLLYAKAARILAPQFLADEDFVKYFIQDGGDLLPDIKEISIFPEPCMIEEREAM